MGMGDKRHAPVTLLQEKRPDTHCTEGWWAPGAVWKGVEYLAPNGT